MIDKRYFDVFWHLAAADNPEYHQHHRMNLSNQVDFDWTAVAEFGVVVEVEVVLIAMNDWNVVLIEMIDVMLVMFVFVVVVAVVVESDELKVMVVARHRTHHYIRTLALS